MSESSKDPAEGRVNLVLGGAKGRMRLIKIKTPRKHPPEGAEMPRCRGPAFAV